MGTLAGQLAELRVVATVPGSGLRGELTGRSQLHVELPEDAYASADERILSAHLATLARLLWVAWIRETEAVIRAADGAPEPVEESNRAGAQFAQALGGLVATGQSADGRVRVRTLGMRQWHVEIEPGSLRELAESQFTRGVAQAAAALVADQDRLVARLRFLRDTPLPEAEQRW